MITTHKSRMRSIALMITLGVVLVVLPSLGFPARIDDHIIFVIGVVLIVMGVLIRRGMVSPNPKDAAHPEA